jgi:hypothetical protein
MDSYVSASSERVAPWRVKEASTSSLEMSSGTRLKEEVKRKEEKLLIHNHVTDNFDLWCKNLWHPKRLAKVCNVTSGEEDTYTVVRPARAAMEH